MKKKEEDNNNECICCLADDVKTFTSLPCGHKFCPYCVRSMIEISNSCIICKYKITQEDIVKHGYDKLKKKDSCSIL
jgi:hypothetical protein